MPEAPTESRALPSTVAPAGLRHALRHGTLAGIALATAGYGVFTLQDAIIKWLVADHTVWQILFLRSVTVTAISALIARRQGFRAVLRSPNRPALLLRGLVILIAWLCYYGAARHLGLAELTTLYYAAPLFVTILSVLLLGERVDLARWGAVALGLVGVVIAANPGGRPDLLPALMVLAAAVLWAWSNILVRQIIAIESTASQMLFSNATFVVASGITMPFLWQTPRPFDLALMVALGFVAALGQFLLFESFRKAPASAVAPCEYTALVWAFLLGYAIWGDLPARAVFIGAGVILLATLLLVVSEGRRARQGGELGGSPAAPAQ